MSETVSAGAQGTNESDRPDWATIRRNAFSDEEHTPPEWPKSIRPISFTGLNLLGVDQQGGLYWDGNPVVIEKKLTLSRWQGVATFLLVTFTVLGGLGALVQGWTAAHQWGCQVQLTTWLCPPK